MTSPLIRKLAQRGPLRDEERRLLESLPQTTREFATGEDMVRIGERPAFSTLLLSGYCGRYSTVGDGSRQITAVHVAGDFVDLPSFLLHKMDHGIVALSRCVVMPVAHSILHDITERFPNLTRLLWLSTLIDTAIHREWLVSMGRRSAAAQLAHLLCELAVKLRIVGLGDERGYRLPFTQGEVADMLGLSAVHAHRVIKDLRERGLITWRAGKLTINDWAGLEALAEFDPAYLHLETEQR